MTLSDLGTAGGASVVVLVLVQLVKQWVPERLTPHAAVSIGVLLVLAASVGLGQTSPTELGNAALTGFLAGASSVGLYQLQRPAGVLPPKPGGGT